MIEDLRGALALAAMLVAVGVAAPARADPPAVRVASTTECPSSAQLAAEVSAWARIAPGEEPGAYVLEVLPVEPEDATALQTVLRGPSGEVLLQRGLPPETDCLTAAQAVSFVAQARLVELHVIAVAEAPQLRVPEAPTPEPARAPPVIGLSLALSLGAELGISPWAPAAYVRIDGAVEAPSVFAGIGLLVATPTEQSQGTDAVRIIGSGAEAFAGLPLTLGGLSFRPRIGVGLRVHHAAGVTIDPPPVVFSFLPAFTVGVEAAWPLSSRLALGLDLHAEVLPLGDSYVIEPDGEVGASPLLHARLGLSLRYRALR